MITRRCWFVTAGSALGAALCCHHPVTAEEISLSDRLRTGLKARTPAEFAFLDHVVDLVDRGQLPQLLVDRVYFWSRKKAITKSGSKKKRPMVYFQPALIELAQKIDIDI